MKRHERLQWARSRVHDTVSDAARALEVPNATYTAHENGGRVFDYDAAEFYARRFNVPVEWLAFEIGKPAGLQDGQHTFPMHLWSRLRPDIQKLIVNLVEKYVGDQVPDKEQVDNLGTNEDVNGGANIPAPRFPRGNSDRGRGRKSRGS